MLIIPSGIASLTCNRIGNRKRRRRRRREREREGGGREEEDCYSAMHKYIIVKRRANYGFNAARFNRKQKVTPNKKEDDKKHHEQEHLDVTWFTQKCFDVQEQWKDTCDTKRIVQAVHA